MSFEFDNELTQQLLYQSNDAMIIADREGKILFINECAKRTFGYTKKELYGQPIERLIPKNLHSMHIMMRKQIMQHPVPGAIDTTPYFKARHKNGDLLAVDITLCPLKNKKNELLIAAIIKDTDVSYPKQQNLEHEASHDKLTHLLNLRGSETYFLKSLKQAKQHHTKIAVCMIDIDNFKEINDKYGHEFGNELLKAFGARLKANVRDIDVVARIGGDEFTILLTELHHLKDVRPIIQKLQQDVSKPFHLKTSTVFVTFSIGVSLFPLDAADAKNLLSCADRAMYYIKNHGKNNYHFYSTELEKINNALTPPTRKEPIEHADDLTGLSNLYKIKNDLQIRLLSQQNKPFSIIRCNLDNFHLINSIQGNLVSDQLLCMIVTRMNQVLHLDEILARGIGDEFIIIFPDTSPAKIKKIAERILAVFNKVFMIHQAQIFITASLGISRYPLDSIIIDELFVYADIALRQAKKWGKNNYQLFVQKRDYQLCYSQQLQYDLSYALERNEFFLQYQPQIDIISKTIVGAEVLLRWKHPTFGVIKPDIFIPLLESSGQIVAVGNWVIEQACTQTRLWQSVTPIILIINVSTLQLEAQYNHYKNQLYTTINKSLKQSGMSPNHLELELTKKVDLQHEIGVKNTLQKLKMLGIHLACDDFGSGDIPFNLIKQLPLDTIKLDQSLICDVLKNKLDRVFIQATIDIAKELNARLVVEGVTSLEQIRLLSNLGCNLIQGYYFSKPISLEKFNVLLKQGITHLIPDDI